MTLAVFFSCGHWTLVHLELSHSVQTANPFPTLGGFDILTDECFEPSMPQSAAVMGGKVVQRYVHFLIPRICKCYLFRKVRNILQI